jgi:hypothetical protein
VGDELQRAAPFEDGAFEVTLAGALSVGVDRRDLAMQGEAFERFGAAFAEAAWQAFAQVTLGRQGLIRQSAAGAEAAGVTARRSDPLAGAEFGEVPSEGVGVVSLILEGRRDR